MPMFAKQILQLFVLLMAVCADTAAAAIPRVLILGDDFFAPAAAALTKTLRGKAEIVHVQIPADLPPTTTSALASIDRLLGDRKWDVIYFSFGLGDLVHRVPGIKSFRVLPPGAGGIPAVGLPQYKQNLEALVAKLSRTGARLVWGSIPPITSASREIWVPGSEVPYNQCASAIMARHEILVNDLHAWLSDRVDPLKSRIPDVYGLPQQFPFDAVMLAAIETQLSADKSDRPPQQGSGDSTSKTP